MFHRADSRPLFEFVAALCWIAWLLLGLLAAAVLFLIHCGALPLEAGEVWHSFWLLTALCLGLPLAVRLLLRLLQR